MTEVAGRCVKNTEDFIAALTHDVGKAHGIDPEVLREETYIQFRRILNGTSEDGAPEKIPLTEEDKNFVGWCVRKIDDFINEFVEENLQARDNPLSASLPEVYEEYEKYLDKLMGAVYAGLGPQ